MNRILAALAGLALLACAPFAQAACSGYTANTSGVTANGQLEALTEICGNQGGSPLAVAVPQTVTASSAYASGNAIGGLMTIANAARTTGGSGLLQSVVANLKSAQTTSADVVIFSANPSGSTCTDKSAISVAAADFDKIIGVAHITDWTAAGTPSVGQAQNLAMPYTAAATSLYACAVTRSTPTYASTSDVSFSFNFIRK